MAYATGDSLMRLLLNTAAVQARVAEMLLEKLAEFSAADAEGATSIPALILGQLKWWARPCPDTAAQLFFLFSQGRLQGS